MPAKPYKRDTKKRQKLLGLLRLGNTRTAAAAGVGVARQTFYDHLNSDAEFVAAVEQAEEESIGAVENALFLAATEDRNITAIQVLLYNRASDRWADKRHVQGRFDYEIKKIGVVVDDDFYGHSARLASQGCRQT